jgi:hypothetical protein
VSRLRCRKCSTWYSPSRFARELTGVVREVGSECGDRSQGVLCNGRLVTAAEYRRYMQTVTR